MDRMVKDGQDGERMVRMVEDRTSWWRTGHGGGGQNMMAEERIGWSKDGQDDEGWTVCRSTGYDGGGEDRMVQGEDST